MIKDKYGMEKIKKNNFKDIFKIFLIFKKVNKIKIYLKKVVSK